MKNPQIELVKKWLADPESVSAEELKRAADAADAAYSAAADAAAAYAAAADAAYHAAGAGAYAAGAYAADAAAAKYWIERYEELTK